MSVKSLKHKLAYIALGGMIAICGMLSTSFLSTINAQNGDATFENIKATQLDIVGDDGEARIRLTGSMGGEGSGIAFYDKSRKTRIFLAVHKETSALKLTSPGIGKNYVSLGTVDTGGLLVISDTDGKIATTVSYDNTAGGVVIVRDRVGGVNRLD